jgi:phosphate transport system substrate-binding protein
MLGRFGPMALAALVLAGCSGGESAPIRATGSSTVYPFTKAVADAFAQGEGRAAPVVQSTGTEGGTKAFCANAGTDSIDILNASRRMTKVEFGRCQANKVGNVIEIPIGLDGVAIAESNQGPKLQLTRKDIYLALAANPRGKPNTAKTWKEVNAALPAIPIQLFGPPASSGTRAAFVDLILQPGCLEAMPDAKALQTGRDPAAFERACRQIRADGAYVTEGEDDKVIVQALERNPNALGLFGYSYVEENRSRLHAVAIDGVTPAGDTIASGKYPGMRSLYLYVKGQNLKAKPQLGEFLNLYATMWSPGGPLAKHGLIALSEKMRGRSKQTIDLAEPLDQSALL